MEDWFVYRYMIDDRIYFIVRETSLLPVPPGGYFVGWLRSDGLEFGGHFRVWQHWLPPISCRSIYQAEVRRGQEA